MGKKVLVVDDHESMRESLERLFNESGDFCVVGGISCAVNHFRYTLTHFSVKIRFCISQILKRLIFLYEAMRRQPKYLRLQHFAIIF